MEVTLLDLHSELQWKNYLDVTILKIFYLSNLCTRFIFLLRLFFCDNKWFVACRSNIAFPLSSIYMLLRETSFCRNFILHLEKMFPFLPPVSWSCTQCKFLLRSDSVALCPKTTIDHCSRRMQMCTEKVILHDASSELQEVVCLSVTDSTPPLFIFHRKEG